MTSSIFVTIENWTTNSLLATEGFVYDVLSRDGDVEIEDDIDEEENGNEYEYIEEDDEEPEGETAPDENTDIFRKDEENLTLSECF
jgi:hypothetical protein